MKKFVIIVLVMILAVSEACAKQTKTEEEHAKNTLEYLNLNWWENYKDDILISHLKNLYEENYDLKNAYIKIKENEKLVKIQLANEIPQISTEAFIGRDFRSSEQRFGSMAIPSYAQNNFQLPLTASYEIDIWGKNRLKTKSIKESLEIAKQKERALYISLTSAFTADYYNLIKTDKLLELQDMLVKTQQDIVSKIRAKNNIGLCSDIDVLMEEKILSALIEERNNIKEKQETLENVIRTYLSKSDGEIIRSDFSDVALIENIPEQYNSNVIEKRPDYIMQEANLKRAGYDVKIAKKELLPSFIIFGQIGLNAYRFSDLFKTSTQLANAGIIPSFDIFSGGRKTAFLKLRKYQYDEALNNYQKTFIEDTNELNTALSSYKTAKENYIQSLNRTNTQDKLFGLTKDKEKIGSASVLDVLYSKEADLIVQKEKISNTINCQIASISLYKAAGGINLLKPYEENL